MAAKHPRIAVWSSEKIAKKSIPVPLHQTSKQREHKKTRGASSAIPASKFFGETGDVAEGHRSLDA
jgi:hypothetical protein